MSAMTVNVVTTLKSSAAMGVASRDNRAAMRIDILRNSPMVSTKVYGGQWGEVNAVANYSH
jgi:hypothetical protein